MNTKHESDIIPIPVIDENIILGSTAGISSSTSLTDEINIKMEIIIGMHN